jgi:hypothetical protein
LIEVYHGGIASERIEITRAFRFLDRCLPSAAMQAARTPRQLLDRRRDALN